MAARGSVMPSAAGMRCGAWGIQGEGSLSEGESAGTGETIGTRGLPTLALLHGPSRPNKAMT